MSNTPLKDAMAAGVKCIGYLDPVTKEHKSRVPNQADVDDEAAKLPTPEQELQEKRQMMVVTPWQIRKALNITNGSRAEVEALIATAPQDTQDGWQYASAFERTNDLVLGLGAALGMTEIELDELFTLAATL